MDRVILTNDDGVDAPGLAALAKVGLASAVIVAPHGPMSGVSHRVTTYEGPIRVEQRSDFVYAVHGTPADCTRIALEHLFPEATVVLAGINPGGNLGVDQYLSGTVAAVREAAMLGRVGIAISHYVKKGRALDWDRATAWTERVLEDLLAREHGPGEYWNVNLPHLMPEEPDPEIVFCTPCTQPLPVKYRVEGDALYYEGVYSDRARDPGADVDLCFSGKITVSLLRL
ncbi:MAG: 5'/3'-nucleotidase SurE [Candidatus Hydrogenedentes bacterium]|nr:5'/3'-nucleotidase SurE [Candidatus Hydrogenedentota bacterium]